MSNERANELILELIKELEATKGTEASDAATIEQAKRLQNTFNDVVNPELDTTDNTLLDDAIALQTSFAVQYPVAEKLIRELVNTLSRLGI